MAYDDVVWDDENPFPGQLFNKQDGSDKDVYYKMTMRLMDLETGLIEWADETEIRKKQSKSLIGW